MTYPGYPPQPQQYGPPAQQYAPPAPPASPADFKKPQGLGSGLAPAVRDLADRVVLFMPKRFDQNVPGVKKGELQDRITMDFIVFDGGPIVFGGNPERGKPHTWRSDTPAEFFGGLASQIPVVRELKEVIGGQLLARVRRGTTKVAEHSPPWILEEVDPADPIMAFVIDLWSRRSLGQFANPELQPLTPPGPAQAYAPPPNYNQGPPPQAYAPPAQAAPDPAYLAWLATQQQQAAPPITHQPVERSPLPNVPDAVWAVMTPDQRASAMNAASGQPRPQY